MARLHRVLLSLLSICLGAWFGLAALLYFLQPRFVYFPSREISYRPGDLGLDYEDLDLRTADGVRVHGWLVPAPGARRTLLLLHGNGGNISDRLDYARTFHDLGLAVLMLDYRGYGRSEGAPSEQGTYEDALAAWNFLTIDRRIAPRDIVIYGQSLGGGVATWLAERTGPGALILESTFTSIEDMARRHYPYLPAGLLVRIHYASLSRMPRIHCPSLIIHSKTDEIVPYELGRRLYASANEPRTFLEIHGGHNDGFYASRDIFARGIREFLHRTFPDAD